MKMKYQWKCDNDEIHTISEVNGKIIVGHPTKGKCIICGKNCSSIKILDTHPYSFFYYCSDECFLNFQNKSNPNDKRRNCL